MFTDRKDAGVKLGRELQRRGYSGVPVFGIPNGGVEVAAYTARAIGSSPSLLISRKLPFPHNPESGFGAIAEDGSTVILEGPAGEVNETERENIAEQQKEEIKRRIRVLRWGKPFPDIAEKTVILVDDGIAMGSTMRAAIAMCRASEARSIVVAVPVAASRARVEMETLADDVIVLEEPPLFQAVAQVYEHWYDVSDEEVRSFLEKTAE